MIKSSIVALRKESVDRNMSFLLFQPVAGSLSLSARRAWIEMIGLSYDGLIASSLSARRAWIEIPRARI